MSDSDARKQVFDMLESGKITADQAVELLSALNDDDASQDSQPADMTGFADPASDAPSTILEDPVVIYDQSNPEPAAATAEAAEEPAAEPAQESAPPDFEGPSEAAVAGMNNFRKWWRYPMWAGVAVTVLGAFFMYLAFSANGFGFWFACAWFPFSFGVAILALAWASRQARWLHVRIHRQKGESPQRIFISLPLPLRLAAGMIRIFKVRTPELDNKGLANLLLALERTSPETPLYVHVDDEEDGERVEVYIG